MSIFEKKSWTDRLTEYPKRRRLTEVEGQPNVFDVDREEGTISDEGDAFNSTNMNGLEDRISEAFDSVDEKIDGSILYSNNTGTTGTVTLSQSCENFKRICVYYGYSGIKSYATFDVSVSLGSGCVNISVGYISSPFDQYYFRSALIYLNPTTITFSRNTTMYVNIGGGNGLKRDEMLSIFKVVGYK